MKRMPFANYVAMLQRSLELDGVELGVCEFAATGDDTLTLQVSTEAWTANRSQSALRNGPVLLHIRMRPEGETPALESADPRFMVVRDTDARSFTPKTVPALLTEVIGAIEWANRQLGSKTAAA